MEDEWKLIILWSILCGFVILYYLWKRHQSLNKQANLVNREEPPLAVHEARLRRFKFDTQEIKPEEEETIEKQEIGDGKDDGNHKDGRCRKRKAKQNHDIVSSSGARKTIPGPSQQFSEGNNADSHFDPDTGSPITQPIRTLNEAVRWRQGFDEFNVASVALTNEHGRVLERPRTLVCHDMKGGYIEDRFVQGYPSSECYRIHHWQYIDVFVYFSHHFISIPPPCWTNAAHTNGVLVLGTFITEWEDGSQRCVEFLEDESSYKALAKQLVDMMEYYNFDGWLINIENPIQPGKVTNLIDFVDYLTKATHANNPSGLIIWYDSVTYKGDLKWQNELNSQNSQFFEASDGIFLNYNWSLHQLSTSAQAATAYQRSTADVYVGADVFGRGCYGGGGYKTREALKVTRQEKLSSAIFAPGWVMETQGVEKFTANQNRFWALLGKECPTHPMVRSIPFVTSLCQGYGNKLFIDGKETLSHPWTNLSSQQTQPSYLNAFYNLGGKGGIIISDVGYTLDDSYNGGGCQLVQGRTCDTPEKAKGVIRLFEADITLSSGMLVSFTHKLVPRDCFQVGIQFHTDRTPTYILLCPAPSDEKDFKKRNEGDLKLSEIFKQKYGVHPSRVLTSSVFTSPIGQEHFEAYAPLTGSDYSFVQESFGVEKDAEHWCTRHYLITGRHLVGCKVKEIRVVCAKPANQTSVQGLMSEPFKLNIGEIKILDPRVLKLQIPTVSSLRHRDIMWKKSPKSSKLSLTLLWDCPIESVEAISYCDVYVAIGNSEANQFVGRAFVDAYRVCGLPVPRDVNCLKFVVRAVTISKRAKSLNNSNSILLSWEQDAL